MLAALVGIGVIGTIAALLRGTYVVARINVNNDPSYVIGWGMGLVLWIVVFAVSASWAPLVLYTDYFRAWMFMAVLFGPLIIILPFAVDKAKIAYRLVDMVGRMKRQG